MLQMPEVLNKDLQVLYSRLFRILVNYSLQLDRIVLSKDITPIFQSFKVVIYSFTQLIKGNTKGVTFKVNIVVVKYQAAQHGRVGLTKFLFKNISLLVKVHKDGQFKVKIIIFTAVFRLVSVKLSQVSQFLAISLYLSRLQICNLQIYSLQICSLRIYSLNNSSSLVRILVYRGVIVRSLKIGCILANKVNFKATQVYKINLVKQVRYKASNYIKFKRSKGSIKFGIIQYLFFSLFYQVFLIQYII